MTGCATKFSRTMTSLAISCRTSLSLGSGSDLDSQDETTEQTEGVTHTGSDLRPTLASLLAGLEAPTAPSFSGCFPNRLQHSAHLQRPGVPPGSLSSKHSDACSSYMQCDACRHRLGLSLPLDELVTPRALLKNILIQFKAKMIA